MARGNGTEKAEFGIAFAEILKAKSRFGLPPHRLCDGVMMNKPIVLKNGKWAYPVCRFQMENINDLDSAKEGALLYVSDPGAKNLELINCVKIPFVPFTEHMFVEKLDGNIWLLSRTQPDWTIARQGPKKRCADNLRQRRNS